MIVGSRPPFLNAKIVGNQTKIAMVTLETVKALLPGQCTDSELMGRIESEGKALCSLAADASARLLIKKHAEGMTFMWPLLYRKGSANEAFVAWLCEYITTHSRPETLQSNCVLALAVAGHTGSPEIVGRAVADLPPPPKRICVVFARELFESTSEEIYPTPLIRQLVKGLGLEGGDVLTRDCHPPEVVIKRHASCRSEDDAEWLLASWSCPKHIHSEVVQDSLVKHFYMLHRHFRSGIDRVRRSDGLVAALRRFLPPGFKASEQVCVDFVTEVSREPPKAVVEQLQRAQSFDLVLAERLLGALGFDMRSYVRSEFWHISDPDIGPITRCPGRVWTSHWDSLPFYDRTMKQRLGYSVAGGLLLRSASLEQTLEWLKGFLTPQDLVCPDGFSCILPSLDALHPNSPPVRCFLEAMGYNAPVRRYLEVAGYTADNGGGRGHSS